MAIVTLLVVPVETRRINEIYQSATEERDGSCGLPLYSALREGRQKAKSDRSMVDRSMADGYGATRSVASHEYENPFRSYALDEETLEMYRDLLSRPLPRLPKLYTLPSRFTETFICSILNSYSILWECGWCRGASGRGKGKVKRTCIAPFVKLQLKALRYGSHRVAPAGCKLHHTCLYLANVRQMAPPERQTSDSARYSFIDPGRMKG